MIMLTKLDNAPILVNLESIKYVEATPDTLIRFLNGDTMIVRESLEDLERRVLELKKRIFSENM
jgi:flagellar protein FlbD